MIERAASRRPSFYKVTPWAAVFFLLASCTVVKDYRPRQPFVYETKIELVGKFTTDERKTIISSLSEQLHDSIRVRGVDKLIGWKGGPRFLYTEIRNPVLYDSLNAARSIIFMQALLHSIGYYRDSITFSHTVEEQGDQYRTTVTFQVDPGKRFNLDSIAYNFSGDTLQVAALPTLDTLQQITQRNMGTTLLRKGEAFSIPLISAELDRLTEVYRNNGYLRFSRDELLTIWDTLGIALLRPTVDPFEQLQQFEALQRRRENPTADIEIKLRTNQDTSHLIRYHVGRVTVFPDLNADTALYYPDTILHDNNTIITYQNLFRPIVVTENIYLTPGELYSQRNYIKTLNRFNSLASWQLAVIDEVPRPGTDSVDFTIRLTPARKILTDYNIEGSQNWGSTFTQGNLIGFNVGVQNRNFARGANQTNTSFRFGTELNPDRFAQTRQVSVGHTIFFPRIVPRSLVKVMDIRQNVKENTRTSLAFNSNFITRDTFFRLASINASWGYEYNERNKLVTLRFPNIEYNQLEARQGLQKLIAVNQSYKYIFNDGLVTSGLFGVTFTGSRRNRTNFLRINGELAGLIGGIFIGENDASKYYRFTKLDVDFRQTYAIRRTAFVWRLFAGVGYGLPFTSKDTSNYYLPFFKAYFAGGANSMRAWSLRKLGPGSAVESFARDIAPDRFGDMQLEFNFEYRFYLANIRGVLINSALFTDIGNIWNIRENPDFPGGAFRVQKLGKDLAIGAGTGLRVDFGFLQFRTDYAYKVKDPSPDRIEIQNKLFHNWRLFNGQLQIGVTYPF